MTPSENPEIQVASTPGSTTESGDHPNLLEAEPYIDRRYFFAGALFHCLLHGSHLGIYTISCLTKDICSSPKLSDAALASKL